MERKIKTGMTASGIVGLVFGILGTIYTVLGIVFLCFPENAEDDPEIGIIFTVLGSVILVVALILIVCMLAHRRRLQNIVDGGKYIWGEIADIVPNYTVRINERNPYVILVRYADRYGNIHLFRSGNLKSYPDRSVIGKQVKVYYGDERFKHYYIDLEGVLPKVIEH